MFLGLDTVGSDDVSLWRQQLSIADQQRAEKFVSERRTRAFVVSRYLLRLLVRQQLGLNAEVSVCALGRPQIMVDNRVIYCSISHSGSGVMVAYSLGGEIGVDIEHHKPRDCSELVDTYFHDDEVRYFRQLSAPDRLRWFYDQWCLKEAIGKLDGEGISLSLLATSVDEASAITTDDRLVKSLSLAGYSAAIAYRGTGPTLFRCYRSTVPEVFQLTEISSDEKITALA